MDDRGKLEWFLVMQITQMEDCITLDQEIYIETLIEKFSMQDGKPSKTLVENNLKLVKATEDEQLIDETLYRIFARFSPLKSWANWARYNLDCERAVPIHGETNEFSPLG